MPRNLNPTVRSWIPPLNCQRVQGVHSVHHLTSDETCLDALLWWAGARDKFQRSGLPGSTSIISDRTKLKFSLRKKLQPAVVLDSIELIGGAGCGRERVEQRLRANWATDAVHPNEPVYTKMALNILEKLSATSTGGTKSNTERKRKRSESSSSSHSTQQQQQPSNTSAGYPQQARGSSQPQGRVYRGQSRGRGSNTGWDGHSIFSQCQQRQHRLLSWYGPLHERSELKRSGRPEAEGAVKRPLLASLVVCPYRCATPSTCLELILSWSVFPSLLRENLF